jgi:uncharacterized beta-barrel protein YwiB (DUF1934 family)
MEVTDLKELKKLMKGDVSNKFEFVEDTDNVGSYNKGNLFSYQGTNNFAKSSSENYNTYQNSH